MPPHISDSDDTEASLSNGEPNTNGEPPRPLLECIPLRVASQIRHNILSDIKYLQDTGHLPRDQEFLLTENFGIRLKGVKSKEEAAGLATEHHWMPKESHGYEISSLRMLIEDLSARPRACHYAFIRAENTLRDILHLAPILLTLNCYDLGELVLGEAYREYAKDIKKARNLLKEIDDESFWEDKNVAEVTFPILMARLLGCEPRTLEPANVFDKIGAISPNILGAVLQMRSCNELDPMDCYVELLDVAITARMMELRLDKMDLGLRRHIEHYVPTWDDN
ncbi:hypothetical protein MGU_01877 [Metarhizium guizhouense ARSEF 977]|uniref:Uncharacterized protein n=1 Tax=Metarhizium guizhouense (strain ARSEF 977) TaxID=1276136 RepID=A0A0B4H6H9_METGA|nr:hypothetical protein MGU_01877 [Metarhizium guizhouense ARSEF 977]